MPPESGRRYQLVLPSISLDVDVDELSQPVITGSTPGHHVRRTVAHKGSSLLGSVQQSSSVRGKRHTTRVLYMMY